MDYLPLILQQEQANIRLQFGDVRPFLDENEDFGPATQQKLLGILNKCTPQNSYFRLWQAICQGYLYFGGDGHWHWSVMKSEYQAAIHVGHKSNVRAVVRNLSCGIYYCTTTTTTGSAPAACAHSCIPCGQV